jgi:hypothetical protein
VIGGLGTLLEVGGCKGDESFSALFFLLIYISAEISMKVKV